MKTVAFIFARGGSKGLPGKNIRPFGGKPLIAWSIEHALAVKRVDQVIVSTDSEEIASIAMLHGADVPFIRPPDLAGDNSSEWLAWQHALNYLKEIPGGRPDIMVSVPATAPLRHLVDIENCLDEYEKGGADVVITVSESLRNPYFNMVKKKCDDTLCLVMQTPFPIVRRQDAPTVYDMATACYVANPEFVLTHNSLFEGVVRAVQIPRERAIDIDTLADFEMAEYFLLKSGKRSVV